MNESLISGSVSTIIVPNAGLGPDPGGGLCIILESAITPHAQTACLAVTKTSDARSVGELVTTDRRTTQILRANEVDNSHESDTVRT